MRILENTKVNSEFKIGDTYKVKSNQAILCNMSVVEVVDVEEDTISYMYVAGYRSNAIYRRPSWEFRGCVIMEMIEKISGK